MQSMESNIAPARAPWREGGGGSDGADVAYAKLDEAVSKIKSSYEVFRRIQLPLREKERDPQAWVALLEGGLPPHLRRTGTQPTVVLSISDCAEILLVAQKNARGAGGVDILHYLGIVEGRWRAVVWLVKQLVDTFAAAKSTSGRLDRTIWPWANEGSLADMLEGPVDLQAPKTRPGLSQVASASTFDELTDNTQPETMSRPEKLHHGVLGQVWRSLGAMIVSCADQVVKPEILEIIAYLHHHEIMPASIYSHSSVHDETAVQQPPTLHLLSSRILTSLSDAAWRAHERIVVEEAQAKGAQYAAIRPEIPGMAYRVNVAGLRPEIWLELVLWSCLHGGWVLEGAAILETLHTQKETWKPLSWRLLMPAGNYDMPDWDKLDYLFNTRSSTTMDPPDGPIPDVKRTVSSEVIDAYADAVLSLIDVKVGERGAPVLYLTKLLTMFKALLARSGLDLGSGSWHTVILRIVESQRSQGMDIKTLSRLVALNPDDGDNLNNRRPRTYREYVSDANTLLVGLCHQALAEQIKQGNLQSSLRALKLLQDITDASKRRSIFDFFRLMRDMPTEQGKAMDKGPFTSNLPRVEHPAFDLQIPPRTLAQFMELAIDAGADDLGRWLLYSDEVDMPLIPEFMYTDPRITPALIQFATKTNDRELLRKLIELRAQHDTTEGNQAVYSQAVALAFFDTQISLRRWDAAERILQYLGDEDKLPFMVRNLATVAHQMLLLRHEHTSAGVDKESDLERAKAIFRKLIRGPEDKILAMYDGLRPNFTTFRIIVRQAAEEIKQQRLAKTVSSEKPIGDVVSEPRMGASRGAGEMESTEHVFTPAETITWAAECLQLVGMPAEDFRIELYKMLEKEELLFLRAELPSLFREAEKEVITNDREDDEDGSKSSA
ncbi:hypothetical protein B0A50_04650 [Salinomyces thailandicus]|uniref:Uncharacterized protein n=1 Tax=Salinomyces thailandicus TaxID=706561 RepID=A0A4U0TUX8_9PEZI|nr:hypothetical protein B0A50_04650 [Salinomyces thailandica]